MKSETQNLIKLFGLAVTASISIDVAATHPFSHLISVYLDYDRVDTMCIIFVAKAPPGDSYILVFYLGLAEL